jgi:8-oxo-dGTP diphosphatase
VNVYLVRHADAGDRESWAGEDELRPLSDKGWRQARELVRVLGEERFDRISSSPYLRCVQTVEPLAEARGLPVVPEPRLAEGANWREAMLMIAAAEVPEVMCSQGDIIAAVIDDLVGQGLVRAKDARWQKASTWVLTINSGRVEEARYLPPPKVQA